MCSGYHGHLVVRLVCLLRSGPLAAELVCSLRFLPKSKHNKLPLIVNVSGCMCLLQDGLLTCPGCLTASPLATAGMDCGAMVTLGTLCSVTESRCKRKKKKGLLK